MKEKLFGLLGIIVMAAILSFQPSSARAGIISTQEIAGQAPADADRAKVEAFLDRADVKQRIEALGVSGVFATQRVDALSDQEVHALAQKIDAMPAGGDLNNTDLIIILLIAVLVALVVS
jgi:hypothetical protein